MSVIQFKCQKVLCDWFTVDICHHISKRVGPHVENVTHSLKVHLRNIFSLCWSCWWYIHRDEEVYKFSQSEIEESGARRNRGCYTVKSSIPQNVWDEMLMLSTEEWCGHVDRCISSCTPVLRDGNRSFWIFKLSIPHISLLTLIDRGSWMLLESGGGWISPIHAHQL